MEKCGCWTIFTHGIRRRGCGREGATACFKSFATTEDVPRNSLIYDIVATKTRYLNASIRELLSTPHEEVAGDEDDFTTHIVDLPKTNLPNPPSHQLLQFTFHELKAVTRDFRPDSILGEEGLDLFLKDGSKRMALPLQNWDAVLQLMLKASNRMAFKVTENGWHKLTSLASYTTQILLNLLGIALKMINTCLSLEFMTREVLRTIASERVVLEY